MRGCVRACSDSTREASVDGDSGVAGGNVGRENSPDDPEPLQPVESPLTRFEA